MKQYILKSAALTEIERIRRIEVTDNDVVYNGALDEIRNRIDTLEVKEVGVDYGDSKGDKSMNSLIDTKPLEVKEIDFVKEFYTFSDKHKLMDKGIEFTDIEKTASFFFQLGLKASNPITATDRGTAEESIISLKRVEKDYRINLTKEIEWLRNKVKKGD